MSNNLTEMATPDLLVELCYIFSQECCELAKRPVSHDADHMLKVWENATVISADMPLSPAASKLLTVVALTHDICDHKYDKNGSLRKRYDVFLAQLGYAEADIVNIHKLIEMAGYTYEKKYRDKIVAIRLAAEALRDGASTSDSITTLCSAAAEACDKLSDTASVAQSIYWRAIWSDLNIINETKSEYCVTEPVGSPVVIDWASLLPHPINRVPLEEVVVIRQIVSEADKLEAMGTDGLIRCGQYVSELHPGAGVDVVNRLVVEHHHVKLSHLYPDGYFTTEVGTRMAARRHEEMAASVQNWWI